MKGARRSKTPGGDEREESPMQELSVSRKDAIEQRMKKEYP